MLRWRVQSINRGLLPRGNNPITWKQPALSHTTTAGTFAIVSLPGICKEDLVSILNKVLGAAARRDLCRATNVGSQQHLIGETQEGVNICLWSLHSREVRAPDIVRRHREAMHEDVREQLEKVGTRVSFSLATPEGAWEAD